MDLHLVMICSAPHHFNSETFVEGRWLIIEGLATIKSNIRLQNFKAARETLGRTLHVLQVRVCVTAAGLKAQ